MKPKKILEIWDNESKRAIELGNWYHDEREKRLLEFSTIARDGVELPIIEPITDTNGIKIAPELWEIMPVEYRDLVEKATYGKEDRGWKDIGTAKELIEEHSLCAGCPESMAFRYILAALRAAEDTVMVGSTGCTSLVFPHVGIHNIHSLFGNQNAVASGLKRALAVRFPERVKDVVVLAGDGATVDILSLIHI